MAKKGIPEEYYKPPATHDEAEKTKWEVIEGFLKAQELLKPEYRKLSAWAATLSTLATITTVSLAVTGFQFQRQKTDLDLRKKQLETDLAIADLKVAKKEVDARELDLKVRTGQFESQQSFYAQVLERNKLLAKELQELKASLPTNERVANLAAKATQSATDTQQAASAFTDVDSVKPVDIATDTQKNAEIDKLVDDLYDGDKHTRQTAFKALVANFLSEKELIPRVLERAKGNISKSTGIYNSIEILRFADRRWFSEYLADIQDFLGKLKTEYKPGTNLAPRVRLLEDRVARAGS